MTRLVSILVAVVLLMGSVPPLAAHQRVPDGSPGEVCPMMSHQPSSVPCVGEPCPCHHGSDSSVLPDGVRLGVPEQTPATTAPLSPSMSRSIPIDPAPAAGFPSRVFHPPDLRS